jgi:hypothetical protein
VISRRSRGQTATEYMLIISVVVIAVVAAAYKFVPLFQQGVEKLGADVKDILSTGQIDRGGGAGMGSGSTARIASRPCDDSAEAARYAAMFDPPPCAIPAPAPWAPSADAAAPLPPRTLGSPQPSWVAPSGHELPGTPEADAAVLREDPVVYLSSARLGRRSRSRAR